METKICKDCGEEKTLDQYHYSNKKTGILKSYCGECSYKRVQAHINEDPLAHRAYMKRYIRENPEKYPGNHITKSTPTRSGVYIISCNLTDDSYVGCSSNLRNRQYKHKRNNGRAVQKDLKKLIAEYGWECFSFDVLELCEPDTIFERETYWIQKLQPNLNRNKTK